jgi:hypothetical protein
VLCSGSWEQNEKYSRRFDCWRSNYHCDLDVDLFFQLGPFTHGGKHGSTAFVLGDHRSVLGEPRSRGAWVLCDFLAMTALHSNI